MEKEKLIFYALQVQQTPLYNKKNNKLKEREGRERFPGLNDFKAFLTSKRTKN